MKSIAAQAAIAAMRPLDRQRRYLTNFELDYLQEQSLFYDADKPLSEADAVVWSVAIADHLNIRAPLARKTKRANPYCMPWGARPVIYLRADHRQPYLIAHEVAHAATRTTMHGPQFLETYLAALVSLGGDEAALRGAMRAHGINI